MVAPERAHSGCPLVQGIPYTGMQWLELKIPPLLVWLVIAGAMVGVAYSAPRLSSPLAGSSEAREGPEFGLPRPSAHSEKTPRLMRGS